MNIEIIHGAKSPNDRTPPKKANFSLATENARQRLARFIMSKQRIKKRNRANGPSLSITQSSGDGTAAAGTSNKSNRALAVLFLLVLATFGFGALRNWRSVSSAPVAAMPSSTPPVLPSNAPAKEFVYAGGSLLSTVEPFRELPNDLGIWRPSTGTWYLLNSAGQMSSAQWGNTGDIPSPGDYDGDGKTDFCVFRPTDNIWYVVQSSGGDVYSTWGANGDIPAVADYDGDGKSDRAVWRETDQTWYILQSTGGQRSQAWGAIGDKPVPADYDGDGKADIAVWRNSDATFYVRFSTDESLYSYSIGASGDEPVVGDYDGDAKADFATRRATDNIWRMRYSSDPSTIHDVTWGQAGDVAVPGRYNDSGDSDAKTDIAVWRPSTATWYIRRSTDGSMRDRVFGNPCSASPCDKPVPANWRR